jgi:hypothetical protein
MSTTSPESPPRPFPSLSAKDNAIRPSAELCNILLRALITSHDHGRNDTSVDRLVWQMAALRVRWSLDTWQLLHTAYTVIGEGGKAAVCAEHIRRVRESRTLEKQLTERMHDRDAAAAGEERAPEVKRVPRDGGGRRDTAAGEAAVLQQAQAAAQAAAKAAADKGTRFEWTKMIPQVLFVNAVVAVMAVTALSITNFGGT